MKLAATASAATALLMAVSVEAQISSQAAWVSGGTESTRVGGNYVSKGTFTADGVPMARTDTAVQTRNNGQTCLFGGASQSGTLAESYYQCSLH